MHRSNEDRPPGHHYPGSRAARSQWNSRIIAENNTAITSSAGHGTLTHRPIRTLWPDCSAAGRRKTTPTDFREQQLPRPSVPGPPPESCRLPIIPPSTPQNLRRGCGYYQESVESRAEPGPADLPERALCRPLDEPVPARPAA